MSEDFAFSDRTKARFERPARLGDIDLCSGEWESPIRMIMGEMQTSIENGAYSVVQQVGFDVDKEELAKALAYSRDQFYKGYRAGFLKAHGTISEDLLSEIFGVLMKYAYKDTNKFKLGDQITYTPEEVIDILREKFIGGTE